MRAEYAKSAGSNVKCPAKGLILAGQNVRQEEIEQNVWHRNYISLDISKVLLEGGSSKESMYLTPWVRQTWKNIFSLDVAHKANCDQGYGESMGGRLPRDMKHPLSNKGFRIFFCWT